MKSDQIDFEYFTLHYNNQQILIWNYKTIKLYDVIHLKKKLKVYLIFLDYNFILN